LLLSLTQKTRLHFSSVLLNVSLAGNKQRTVSFPQLKQLSRSTGNSSVSVCTCKRTPQNSLQLVWCWQPRRETK